MKTVVAYPAKQRVVIDPVEEQETKTNSGIILPKGTESDTPGMGVIVETGTGDADNPMEYMKGQTVCYSQYAGLDVKLNLKDHGEKVYKIMNQADIMMVIQEV